MGLFDRRVAYQPFEYPEAEGFRDAINHAYWLVSEWNFIGDVQDFALMPPEQREVVKRALLAISQIEVNVKKFWGKIGDRFPKAEIDEVGATFADSEVRHAQAYSRLLKVLGLNADFETVLQVPAIGRRVRYLSSFLGGTRVTTDEQYALVLTLFSAFIENVSLFSQFAIVKSFNKANAVLKDIDNVIQATQKEEQIHFLFGAWLVNQIKKERPEWFGPQFYEDLRRAAIEAYDAELTILYWIFESGELPWLPKSAVKAFLRKRINESVAAIGGEPVFKYMYPEDLAPLKWFEEELHAGVSVDFFHKRSVDYTKGDKAIKPEDLF